MNEKKEGASRVTTIPQERERSEPILSLKFYEQKRNECQFATIAMLTGVDYEEVRREACKRFGFTLGKLKYGSKHRRFVTVVRSLYQDYGIGFYPLISIPKAFSKSFPHVPVGVGEVRFKLGRRKKGHVFPYEKHKNGSVTFYDPGLPWPIPRHIWEAFSAQWEIESVLPAEKLEILVAKLRSKKRSRSRLKDRRQQNKETEMIVDQIVDQAKAEWATRRWVSLGVVFMENPGNECPRFVVGAGGRVNRFEDGRAGRELQKLLKRGCKPAGFIAEAKIGANGCTVCGRSARHHLTDNADTVFHLLTLHGSFVSTVRDPKTGKESGFRRHRVDA